MAAKCRFYQAWTRIILKRTTFIEVNSHSYPSWLVSFRSGLQSHNGTVNRIRPQFQTGSHVSGQIKGWIVLRKGVWLQHTTCLSSWGSDLVCEIANHGKPRKFIRVWLKCKRQCWQTHNDLFLKVAIDRETSWNWCTTEWMVVNQPNAHFVRLVCHLTDMYIGKLICCALFDFLQSTSPSLNHWPC